MIEYDKIQSVFKRDPKTHKFIETEFSLLEFEYLKDSQWIWTEKINGTNIRVNWDLEKVRFGGKTENAQIPTILYDKLNEMFPVNKFKELYPETPLCLYGEGYGAKIQKGGGNYIPNGVSFILFDTLIDSWWIKREDILDIAIHLGIDIVPIIEQGTLTSAIEMIKAKTLYSMVGVKDFLAEEIVLKPKVELKCRNGKRIITKLKHSDF